MLPAPDTSHRPPHPGSAPLTRRAVEDILSQHGYRLTGPRATIVETMLQYDRPFTAEQLVGALRPEENPEKTRQIGRATVYRTLEILASVDVLTRLIQADGHPAYVWDTPGHRHHLVCTSCGTAVSFTSCPISEIVSTLTKETDFVIQDHMLEVFGLCPTCQSARNVTAV
ncbi:MAG: Fur family transcriptional regulator [Thermomicrobiales bacterium]